ncbi:MAG TPA: hypothetical protein PL108_02920 [Sediminibacterium sp.]|nr:hypothetical protein [Sediminibacterium sp.]
MEPTKGQKWKSHVFFLNEKALVLAAVYKYKNGPCTKINGAETPTIQCIVDSEAGCNDSTYKIVCIPIKNNQAAKIKSARVLPFLVIKINNRKKLMPMPI